MATINHSAGADIIVPSNNGTTYRGLAGDDTYIISNSIAANATITIVDTSGANKIQLVDGLSIASSAFAADAVQLTLSNGAVVTINGASNFTYDVGGNATSGTSGTSNTLSAFAASMGVATLPSSGSTAGSSNVTVSGSAVSSSASPTYTLSKDATSVDEGSAVTFTITSSSAVSADTSFSWTVIGSDNGATVDKATSADLDAQSGTATIASGATSTTFSVTALADSAGEGVEGIKVSVFDPNSATVGSHTVLINNTGAAASAQAYTGTTSYDAFTGGTGNDTFTFTVNDSLANTDAVDGGAGSDTLVATLTGSGDANTERTPNIENIEILKVKNDDTSTNTDLVTYNLVNTASKFTTLWNDNSSENLSFTNVQVIPDTLKLSLATGTTTLNFAATADLSGAADALTIEVLGTNTTTVALTGGLTLTGRVIETVTVHSDSVANTLADLQTTGVGTTTLNTTGATQLTITAALDAEIATIDASGMTGTSGLSLGAAPSITTGVTATGSGGADTIYGSAGNDIINTGAGNDTINLGTIIATDTVDGGAGTDTVVATASVAADSVFAGLSNVETLSLTGAIDATLTAATPTFATINASDANNNTVTLDTTYGATTTTVNIDGDAASGDTIVNSSASTLVVVAGSDDLAGANNTTITASLTNLNDEIQMTPSGAGSIATNITGIDKITIVDAVTGNNATTLTLGAYATALTIDASALDAADAALTIAGGNLAASLTYTGGAGADIVTGGGTLGDNISGGAGADSIAGTAGNNTIDGGAGADILALGTGTDNVSGGAGNDIIVGGAQVKADDTIDGGDGTDTLTYTGAIAFSTILGGLSNVEVLAPSGDIATTLQTAIPGVSTISLTQSGDQTVTFATGYTGAATVSLLGDSGSNADAVINTANIELTVSGYGLDFDADTTITGGTGTDTIIMTNSANFSAVLTNVTGVETITVNDATLNANANITTGANNLSALTIDTTSLDAGENTTIDASARIVATTINAGNGTNNLQGGTANDIIVGGSGVDTIDGQANSATLGADNISAGAGNDIINVSTAETEFSNSSTTALVTDTIDGGAGTDTLNFANVAMTLTGPELANISNVEVVTMVNASSITLTNEFLTNNPGVSLTLGTGTVLADTTGTTVNLTEAVTFVTASGDINFTSGTGNDNFITNASLLTAADTINMGAGTDTITVRNNTSLIDGTGNAATVVLAAVSGVETVLVQDLADSNVAGTVNISTTAAYAGTSLTIDATALDYDSVTPANSEVATINVSANAATEPVTILGGDGLDVLTGGAGADSISGAGSNDSVTGGGGADTLTGGVGVDTIDAGAGLDNVDAGAGNDIINITTYTDFQTTGGTETVDGGAGTDTLVLKQATAPTITAPELSTVSNIEVIDAHTDVGQNETTLTLSQAFMDNNGGTITIDGNETAHANADHDINASTVSSGIVIFQTEGDTTGKNDTFTGGAGNDIVIIGTTGQTNNSATELEATDVLDGNGGTDVIQFNNRGNASNAGSGGIVAEIDFDNVTEFEKVEVVDADGATGAADAITLTIAALTGTAPVTFEVDASVITDADDDLTFNKNANADSANNGTITTRFTVKGGAGDDIIYGAAGSDTITTGNGSNVVVTGNATTVGGGAGGDNVTGGTGVDNVTGGTGADTINSAGGADIIVSGGGNDIIDGGAGADVITGGTGADNITGGSGNDTFKYAAGDSAGATKDTITDFAATTTASAGDKLEIALTLPSGGITFTETDRGDVASTAEAPGNLAGVRGDFVFIDGTSTFSLDVNGDGNLNVNDLSVTLTGETAFAESDVQFNITGGAGADTITLLTSADTVSGGDGADTINGGGGADDLSGGDANAAADTVNGDAGNDIIRSDLGNDILNGGAGDDTFVDGAGNDVITGGAGADTIDATTGTVTVKWSDGDGGADGATTGYDVIAAGDFTPGTDLYSFDHSELASVSNGSRAITSIQGINVNTNLTNINGVFVLTANIDIADMATTATTIANTLTNEAAGDSLVIIADDTADTWVLAWNDATAAGGDNDGVVDAAELQILAKVTGVTDASANMIATGDVTVY